MWDIFLSYSRDDTTVMRLVRDRFSANGLDVWMDDKIVPGTPAWSKAIENAIENTYCIVILMSGTAKSSEWVEREILYADTHKRRKFPVLVKDKPEESIPFILAGVQFVDIRFEFERNLGKLIAAIQNFILSEDPQRRFDNALGSPTSGIRISDPRAILADVSKPFSEIVAACHPLKDLVKFEKVEAIQIKDQKNGDYPLYSVTGIQSHLNRYQFDGEYVIVPNVVSKSSPVAFVVNGRFSGTSSVFVLKTLDDIIQANFLVLALRRVNILKYVRGVIPRISKRTIQEIEIPVPSIEEQQLLVEYFANLENRVDEMRRVYSDALFELDMLLPSVLDNSINAC